MMFSPNPLGYRARIRQLTKIGLAIAHSERLYTPCGQALHESGDGARIDPATQEHAKRHVAHEPRAHSVF